MTIRVMRWGEIQSGKPRQPGLSAVHYRSGFNDCGSTKLIIMRKNIQIICITILSAMMVSVSSCSKKDFDINSPNTNQPSVVTHDLILSAALTSTANEVLGGD